MLNTNAPAELTASEDWHRLSYLGLVLIPARSATTFGGQSKASGKNLGLRWRCADNPPRPRQLPPFQEAQSNVYLYPIHCRSASAYQERTRAFSPGRAQYCASGTCQVAEAQFCALARFRVVIYPGPPGENRGAMMSEFRPRPVQFSFRAQTNKVLRSSISWETPTRTCKGFRQCAEPSLPSRFWAWLP